MNGESRGPGPGGEARPATSTAPPALPAELGPFELRAVLGEGGSGTVYDARWGHRTVALKVLRAELVPTDRERDRFFAEAALLQAVDHAGVVKVLGSGTLPDGRPYLAMERLDGDSLAARVARGPIPVADALALFEQLASAVHALHGQGLIHRDIKPENVILAGPYPVLLDFGIAKSESAPASTVTQEGTLRGTPAYMAPERFFGAPASVATDLYELAVLFYAMVTGRLPWDSAADPSARLNPPRPADLGHPLPGELETAVLAALSTRAEARPASVAELARRMREAAEAGGIAPRRTESLAPGALPAPAGPAGPAPRAPRSTSPPSGAPPAAAQADASRRRRRIALVSVALLVLAAGLAVVLASTRGSGRAGAAPLDAGAASASAAGSASGDAGTAEPAALGHPPPLWPHTASTADDVDRLLSLHPRDTLLLARVSIAGLRASPLVSDVLDQQKSSASHNYLAMLDAVCGFDLVASLDDVSIGLSQDTQLRMDLVARGHLSRPLVEKCLARMLAPDGRAMADLTHHGRLTQLAGKRQSYWLAWPDPHTLLFTTRPVDAAWMKVRLAGRESAAKAPHLVALLDSVDTSASLWMVAAADPHTATALPGTEPPRAAYASVRIGDQIQVDAGLRYGSIEQAERAARYLQAQLGRFKQDPLAALWLASGGFGVRGRDAVFTLSMNGTMAHLTLQSLVEMSQQWAGKK